MEKKLAVIVDNKEVTTEVVDTEMCSSACDVVMETCSSQSHDAYRGGSFVVKKRQIKKYYKQPFINYNGNVSIVWYNIRKLFYNFYALIF